MSERIDIPTAAQRLGEANNVLIICHKNPDGDTVGSAGSLYWVLKNLGKTAAVVCSDPINNNFSYMDIQLFHNQFVPAYFVAVDIAGQQLFGDKTSVYVDRIDLCIDHHGSNSGYARELLLDDTAAANCEILFDLFQEMQVGIDAKIANCLYTGVSTDTGCFRFGNTTARTHRVAAELIDLGADLTMLNEVLFENKSRTRLAVEQLALSTLEFHREGTIALIVLTRDQITSAGAETGDLEGITAMPRAIEGVWVGITMRQLPGGSYKISVRTKTGVDAVDICRGLGGGGHRQAAGCEIIGGLDYAKAAILAEAVKVLDKTLPSAEPGA